MDGGQSMDADNQLMARLQHGDTDALEALITRHRLGAEQYAARILDDAALAEDVVQEAFVRVYVHRAAYQPSFTFRTWLMVLVRRLCIDQLRRLSRAPVTMDALPDVPTASAEEACLRRLEQRSLLEALASLEAVDQALLTGFALEGLSYQQLAARHRMTAGQVRIRLHRLRKRLREKERDPL